MTLTKKLSPIALATSLAIGSSVIAPAAMAVEGLSGNATITNNYIWRGLTQTINRTAIQGGIDYDAGNGWYVGTWVSNVEYAEDDPFSYEHDVYFGYAGETGGGVGYDLGYLYYNYDDAANFDFAEIYGILSFGGFSASANVFAHSEANDTNNNGSSFDFADTIYYSANYTTALDEELELTFHVGFHDGDFSQAFNGVTESYIDYNVSLAKGPFAFTVSDTDLGNDSDDGSLDNDELKFVISYTHAIDL
ncbi:MAG: hypothetical protein GXP21_02470 [Gammaproteobacteria bacterium]|nr:hypothetical protein [Gammaproteobacteria bacterium]